MITKKVSIRLFVLMLAVSASVQLASTQETQTAGNIAVKYVDYLFDDGFKHEKNQQKLYKLSALLSPEQRKAYYDANECSAVAPFLLNLLVGFGIGSFVQGDTGTGHVQLWGDLAGEALMITGVALAVNATSNGEANAGAYALVGVGSVLTTAVTVIVCIRPWFYTKAYNGKLFKALRLGDANGSISVLPVLEPVSNSYGLTMRLAW